MDWLAKMIGLPSEFWHCTNSMKNVGEKMGGGVIQTTASEATFVSLLAARTSAINRMKQVCKMKGIEADVADINSRLVAYCSDQVS